MDQEKKEKKDRAQAKIYGILASVLKVGLVLLAIWIFFSWASSSEKAAQKRQDDRETEIIRETEDSIMSYVYDELPDLESVLIDAYYPDDLRNEYEDGFRTAEEILDEYEALYNSIERAKDESELYK